MYVRDARNRDEAWLLDRIEEMGLDSVAFRSRDYVIAVDESTNERAGFGRYRIHKTDEGEVCELTGIGVVDGWRGQGVGAHVVERLIDLAADEEFETVYSITDSDDYLRQFGFESVDPDERPPVIADRLEQKRRTVGEDVVVVAVDTDAFEMPAALRQRFKEAEKGGTGSTEPEETAEDFGIDADEATYKYDTGN
ncbi:MULTISPECIES: GNAT family N-acetyltransferase [Halolamina]|uniref:N-acetylglutamate synthase, GNAT family n=1 Tax=Halolamina pelagica TaxID=699431 RepID=A0A1I5QQZ3_9EURY|nr:MULTISPECIES: GNAT family N-acetyltransferase [Halolamina]NHX35501.1 GNAT family N-acetyltransferase [Halolamina sp. R1-12]SFP48704.1 N-acetylglutamate synthase, GNAT family [Halolamina pelagica]